jgi:hypothetical protein
MASISERQGVQFDFIMFSRAKGIRRPHCRHNSVDGAGHPKRRTPLLAERFGAGPI